MKINIIAAGKRMPAWVDQGFSEYARRFSPAFSVKLTAIALRKRRGSANIDRLIYQEGEAMLQAIGRSDVVIALDPQGAAWSTQTLVNKLSDWAQNSISVSFLIGGPEGLAPACLERADQKWSLSSLTMPHMLIRIILIEALYRAYTVIRGHPYHR